MNIALPDARRIAIALVGLASGSLMALLIG